MSTIDVSSHKDIRQANKTVSEKDVQCVLFSFENFGNPFSVDNKDALYCISSGSPLAKYSEQNVLEANTIGQQAYAKFVRGYL